MRRHRYWRPDDSLTLAEWIENEVSSGEFDDAIAENIERDPSSFANTIEKLIEIGQFDRAVIERAKYLGYIEDEG